MRPFACAIAVLLAGTTRVAAEDPSWPTRPIKFVSTYAAGGPTDIIARPVVDHLSKVLGQPVLIENRPGAGSTLGAQYVARAEPDGYTLLFGTTSPFAVGPVLYAKAGYTTTSFTPIILVAESPMMLNVSIKSGVKTVAELVTAAKKDPAAFTFASVGVATAPHLWGELFNIHAGLKMAHVPYRGSSSAQNDLIGGQVQVFFDVAASAYPNIEAGNVRAIMALQEKRTPLLPDVPTALESGYPEFIGSFWGALAGPTGTPDYVVERLNREINAFIARPETVEHFRKVLFVTIGGPPSVLTERIQREAPLWKTVGEKAGVKVE